MCQPKSLVAKVFKAMYYPQSSFLAANIGSSPSFIWRSLLAAQDMLKQGTVCRVGSGATINITSEPWLSCEDNPFVLTDNAGLMGKPVSSLMVTGEKQWDTDLIHDMFNARDASLILSIPLSNNESDYRYWKKEKLGSYSIKSAYVLIQENKLLQNSTLDHRVWRRMWNLKIPPKVKHLVWRAMT